MIGGLVYLDEFTYSTTWLANTPTALGAGGDVTTTIQINSDSDFIAQEYSLVSNGATVNDVAGLPDFLITITRSGSGRNIMNNPQRVLNFLGNYWNGGNAGTNVPQSGFANWPGRLPISSLYQGNSTVQIRLQNPTSLVPFRVDFSMRGFKCFYQTNSAGQTGNRQQIFHAL
jgi:hypothetical protein